MTIFVHQDRIYGDYWHERFVHLLSERYHLQSRLIDLLTVSIQDLAPLVSRRDGLIGRWGHAKADLDTFKPIVDNLVTLFGGRMFPASQTYSYYDDKARQAALFSSRGYPTPPTAVVGSMPELEAFLARESLSLPIVVKRPDGAQSLGVRLLLTLADASFPCIAQRYCPGNNADFRICVIGHRVMGFMRRNRPNDFRASGSGNVVHVDDLPREIVDIAARISSENGFESMAYDFIRLGAKWVVLEMSYTYPHSNLRKCAYYYDTRTGERVPKAGIYPEDFIIEDFLTRYYPDACQGRATL